MNGARFIFLGTGTSGGVPQIACDCEVCTSTDPRDTRTRTGAAVEWTDPNGQQRILLIDTTPDLRQQALREKLWRCDGIVYTHNHVDHIFGLDEVRRFNAAMQAPIDVYADAHTIESLRRVYKHIFEKEKNQNQSFVATLIPNEIQAERGFVVHGLKVMPFKLLHGRQPILGFRLELAGGGESDVFPLAYCTDVSGIPPESWKYLRDLKTLVLDGLRIRHHPTHFNLDQAVQHALEIGAGQTWLVHIAHEILHAREDAELPEGISLAYDGLVLGAAGPPDGAEESPIITQTNTDFDEG